jgi:DNA-binding NarL/FixJ family response regulator
VKIVMMSIDNSRENVRSCIDLGIDGFLAKPFSREAFLNAVSRLVPAETVAAVGNEVYEWL